MKPVNAAPVTVNEALSPGSNPSLVEPPAKFPEGPVINPKSRTTLVKLVPGTVPSAASENVKLDERLGACIPVNPLRPELLALPLGGKSKPMPVIVDVDPGEVMADVFVIVNVNVLVCELKLHTTVAVEACPVSAPTIVIVSARAELTRHAVTIKVLAKMSS